MSGYNRPEGGWRFNFQGVKTNSTPDAISATKYPFAQNIRTVQNQSVQTRPGYELDFTAAGVITDIRAYSTLNTDNLPRLLARNTSNQIYLDDGSLVATLAGTSIPGAVMIPFRPSNSPQAWMYIGTQEDYQKLSAPDANDDVTAYKVGIQEPTSPPDVSPSSLNYYSFSALAAGWTQGGTAGAPADANRIAGDTATTAIVDPASSSLRWSVQVGTTIAYQIGQLLNIAKSTGGSFNTVVEDVLPPLTAGATLTIQSIMYYSGTTGRCVITPTQLPAGTTTPTFSGNTPTAESIFVASALSSLRRGSLVKLNASETVLVLSVTVGPAGIISFETSTAGTFAAAQAIIGIPAIVVSDINATVIGQTITSIQVNSAITTGTATLTQALATNPFVQALAPSANTPQLDDYVCFGIKMTDISKLTQGVITFDVKNAAADYVTDAYYYIFNVNNIILPQALIPPFGVQANPALLAGAGNNPTQITQTGPQQYEYDFEGNLVPVYTTVTTDVSQPDPSIDSLTPLPTSQWATVLIPIRSLVRLGNDQTRSLANCQGVRISLLVTANVTVSVSSFWVGGGGQPDVSTNSPYFYCFRGRSEATGAKSNPSPITRYGVNPRRQQVLVTITDTVSDGQCDVWDVYRYGGTVTSWRYTGSIANTASSVIFTDNFFDTAAISGSLIEYDNFEPWPTIDVPFAASAGTTSGITTLIQARGPNVLVIYSAAAPFTNPIPDTVLDWLPGTLATVGGQSAYTLWTRPTAVTLASPPAADYYAYLFQFVECIGSLTPSEFNIREPNVANQHLPYLWGVDAYGTMFGAGDPLRPGTIYFAKAYNPDSAPDSYNQEITSPSEPILGGEIVNGLSYAASSKRWWALYPNFGSGGNRYQAVEKPFGWGLAAPNGHCTDGKNIYGWGKDGIYRNDKSLTDADLFNIFPHEGVNTPQDYTYDGYTIYAPDYKYAAYFRLSFCNGYLYADYRDSGAVPRTLVCDLTDPEVIAWQPDFYNDFITVHYAVEQQESTLQALTARYPLLVMGDNEGLVHLQAPLANDNGEAIPAVVSTFEYNGGDLRSNDLFNDAFIDAVPVSGLLVATMSNGVAVITGQAIAASASRVQTSIFIGLELPYCGVLIAWTDDFDSQSLPTRINVWQPMYQSVPVGVFRWKTQKTSFGMLGYKHLKQWVFAYKSTAAVVITVTAYDGTSPSTITLPSTSGVVEKVLFPFTFNKGLLYDVDGVSTAEWTPYLSESELYVGSWERSDEYKVFRDIEAPEGIRS